MMTPESLLEHVVAEPFRPFRLHMASGPTFEVRHPEMIQVGRTFATVSTPRPENRENDDLWQKISLVLIESVEPIGAGSKPVQQAN